MIIKATRHATAVSARRVIDHLFRGTENDAVTVLQGSERDLRDAWQDARAHGAAKALRVWILAPAIETTREQAMAAFRRVADEFAFDFRRAVVVEHDKERATPGAFDRHWHCAVGETDPASGRVLSSSFDMPRHEYLARSLEHQFGHPFILGRHTKAVLARMRREGLAAMADALDAVLGQVAGEKPPREAFSTEAHQRTKRKGIDLAEKREIVTDIWKAAESFASLTAAMAESGLRLTAGLKVGEWLVFRESEQLGSLRRLTKTRKADFSIRTQELIDADDRRNGSGPELRGTDPRGVAGGAFGPGQAQAGRDDPERVRDLARPTDARRRREPVPGDDAPSGVARRRNGGDAQASGSLAPGDGRSSTVGSPAIRDPIGPTASTKAAVNAVFQLVQRASVTVYPMPTRVEAALARHEAAVRVALAARTTQVSRDGIALASAREKAARLEAAALSAEIDATSDHISSLVADQARRKRSAWLRWFPDASTDAVIAQLREHRDGLRARYARLNQKKLLAEVDARNARTEHARATAQAIEDRDAALRAAVQRGAILAVAKRLLAAVPTLAYVGTKRLLALAARVEHAREQGYDPGPVPPGGRII